MGQSIAASNHGAAIDQDKQEIKAVEGLTTDLTQLNVDLRQMSNAYDIVMNVYNDPGHTYTEALPELFILSIDKDKFSKYMESIAGPLEKVSEIIVNHCSSYSCGKGKTCWKSCPKKNNQVLLDAKLLTDILGTQITSMNSFYQKYMEQQHMLLHKEQYKAQMTELRSKLAEGASMAHQLNATINTIKVKKAQAAQGAVKVLAQQRRQFMLYAEANTAPVSPIVISDDAEVLRK